MFLELASTAYLPRLGQRAFLSGGTALLVTVALMPIYLRILRRLKVVDHGEKGDSTRLDALHRQKRNTPTMGGVVPLVGMLSGTALWVEQWWPSVCMVLGMAVAVGLIGVWDDMAKLRRSGHGLWPREKLLLLLGLGILGGVFCQSLPGTPPGDWLLFTLFPLWVSAVLAGTANAVNLTDGLDGLASGCLALAAAGLAVGAAACGSFDYATYLGIKHVAAGRDISVLCAALAGASVGFLVFNSYPARVFMGDTGSLGLGGALAFAAIIVRQELLLLLLGGVFVAEALSVLMQVFVYKLWRKRVFLIAPLHHHFEFKGWPEVTVTTRFWICGAALCLCFVVFLLWR
jgi:phospho-N-acetylmuramoyl-pentapeptide-transferase